MATLNNANIINGNTVETADILQLYTALGTGNPGDITGLVITGSLKGDVAGTSTNTNFVRVNNNTTDTTIYSVLFADSPVSSANKQVYADSGSNGSGMHYQPSTDKLFVTASYALEVLNGGGGSSLTMTTTDGTNPATTGTWIPIAGVAVYSGAPINAAEVDVQIVFGINSPSFGVDFFITANQIAPPSSPAVSVSPSITGNVVTFEGATSDVVYQGWYK
tara:strand:+ start:914 stop:1573 length:660 start_codon:yes stop_codon:yes gene_type:complete